MCSLIIPKEYITIFNTDHKEARMKTDWDVIKELLNEVEPLHQFNGLNLEVYYMGDRKSDDHSIHKMEMARLLLDEGYLVGMQGKTIFFGGFTSIHNMRLTFKGHDLLDKLNDEVLWSRMTKLAKQQGIKITFGALGTLATAALQDIFT